MNSASQTATIGGLVAPRAVLGVDAAWTSTEPSGVALAVETEGGWRLAAVEASYGHFAERAKDVDPGDARPLGEEPMAAALLDAAHKICGRPVDLVAVDMPLSRKAITGRRCCDNKISIEFGSQGASTHTPSITRPGPLSDKLRMQFEALNYRLCTSEPAKGLIEVYPHPALIRFLKESYRLKYKAIKVRRYWPKLTPAKRQLELRSNWARIVDALDQRIVGVAKALPPLATGALGWARKA